MIARFRVLVDKIGGTRAPTSSVVIDTLPGPGWIFNEKLEIVEPYTSVCQNNDIARVVALYGMPTGKCQPSDSQPGKSIMYGCDQGKLLGTIVDY